MDIIVEKYSTDRKTGSFTEINNATDTKDGFMSAGDKSKLGSMPDFRMQSTAPNTGLTANKTIWIDISNPDKIFLKLWNGTSWKTFSGAWS